LPANWAQTVQPYLGRWDVAVKDDGETYPSWFEVQREGQHLKGRFVGQSGSARPIDTIDVTEGGLEFSVRPQYEQRRDPLVFKGRVKGEQLEGTTVAENGKSLQWTAVRAPVLKRAVEPVWGKLQLLFNGKDLAGWNVRHASQPNGWKVEDGILTNTPPSVDLISEQAFEDFKLHVELQVPEGGNSGIYLRGRYEVQVEDSFGKEPDSHYMGGIYGFLTPTSNAYKRAGEWQTLDVTLVGRLVTVVLNGTTILNNLEIPGITGGALDSKEGEPGPLMIQGDHTGVAYRNILITRAQR
jgi:hypothetical protein